MLCCRDIGYVSIQGLQPSKDLAFAVFKGESFGETLLTASTIVKWDGLAFGAFLGCVAGRFALMSPFLPPRPAKVTIYATWCCHFRSFFLLLRPGKETWRPWRIVAMHPPKRGKRRPHLWAALEEALNWDSLCTAMWHNWPSNAASEGCRPWIETQQSTEVSVLTSKLRPIPLWSVCSSSVNTNTPLVHELPFQTTSCTFCRLFNCTWVVNYTNQNTDTEAKLL